MIEVALCTLTPVAGTPPIVTVAPVANPRPVIVTAVPPCVDPMAGEMPVTWTTVGVGSVGVVDEQDVASSATASAATEVNRDNKTGELSHG
jgi:hypothetical protein